MISSFWVHVGHSFCNYLYSKIEHLTEQDLLTFRNEAVKLLIGTQYKAKKCKRHVTTTQEVTTFQLPDASHATTGREYNLTILDTQQVSTPAVQPTQIVAPQPPMMIAEVPPQWSASASSQPAYFILVHDQQRGPSRQLLLALSPTKTFNPSSVTSG